MTFSNGGAGGEFKGDHFQRSGKDSGMPAGEVEHLDRQGWSPCCPYA